MAFFAEEGLPDLLVLNFRSNDATITTADLERIAKSERKYTKLEVNYSIKMIELRSDLKSAAFALLRMLGETVTQVTIRERSSDYYGFKPCSTENLAELLFCLQRVTKCKLINCFEFKRDFDDQLLSSLEVRGFDFMANVEELEMINCDSRILKMFRGCKRLDSFKFGAGNSGSQSDQIVNALLLRQTRLQHLKIADRDSRVNPRKDLDFWMPFSFKLKTLCLFDCEIVIWTASLFLAQQNELESLGIYISGSNDVQLVQLRDLLVTIWQLPRLKHIEFNLKPSETVLPENFFDDFPRNNTIESIASKGNVRNFERILNTLDAVKEIN